MDASPGDELCVWHNASLNKSDAYVAILLAQVISMVNGDLSEYFLSELDWPGADLSNKRMDGVDLRDGHLPKANLSHTNLQNSNLRRCNLRKANLQGSNLSGCDLKHTDLFGADLSGANLSHAQLDQTNLLNANLSNVNFEGVHVESFQWSERTIFEDVQGLEAQAQDNDETQTFLTPVALADYHKKHRSSSILQQHHDQVLQTHTYSNASSSTLTKDQAFPEIPNGLQAQPNEEIVTAATFVHSKQTTPTIKKQAHQHHQFMVWVSVAAVLIAVSATAYASWASYQLAERPVKYKEVTVVEEVIKYIEKDAVPLKENPEYLRITKQNQDLLKKEKILKDAYRQNEFQLKKTEKNSLDLELQVARLSVHNDDMISRESTHLKLKKKYQKLLRHASRLNDTASILAKGVDRLSEENNQLNDIKNTRLNTRSQLELLQTKSLQLQHENDQLKKDSTRIKEHNQTILAELTGSRKTLERFLSRIEGSRLHAFLTKDASQLKAIEVKPNTPIVLTGDHLITLELSRAKAPNEIISKLFVQRSNQDSIPDINIIFYNSDMKATRSMSYGFPGSDSKNETYAISKAQFNSTSFPSYVRILVNPGVDAEIVSNNNSTLSRLSHQ
ncbi:MAG: pentapeptide repeat-containing protein [Planctomycetes bacterium]|nr:pentapeptide repeat-containing protein [Planctomycetota bacterium]